MMLYYSHRSLLFGILIKIVFFYYYLAGKMTVFVKQVDAGLGVFYIRTSVDQVNCTRTNRATGSGYPLELLPIVQKSEIKLLKL